MRKGIVSLQKAFPRQLQHPGNRTLFRLSVFSERIHTSIRLIYTLTIVQNRISFVHVIEEYFYYLQCIYLSWLVSSTLFEVIMEYLSAFVVIWFVHQHSQLWTYYTQKHVLTKRYRFWQLIWRVTMKTIHHLPIYQ